MDVERITKAIKKGGLYLTRGLTQPTVKLTNRITGKVIRVHFVGWHMNKKYGPQIRLQIDAPDEYKISRPERTDGSQTKV